MRIEKLLSGILAVLTGVFFIGAVKYIAEGKYDNSNLFPMVIFGLTALTISIALFIQLFNLIKKSN